jgi:hypothetical protein
MVGKIDPTHCARCWSEPDVDVRAHVDPGGSERGAMIVPSFQQAPPALIAAHA